MKIFQKCSKIFNIWHFVFIYINIEIKSFDHQWTLKKKLTVQFHFKSLVKLEPYFVIWHFGKHFGGYDTLHTKIGDALG